jgi:hypothetical protein
MNNEKIHNQLAKNEVDEVMTGPALMLVITAVYFLAVSVTLTLSPGLQAQTVNASDNIHRL